MATKHWVKAALQSLDESLSPVPHEVNEIDWKAQLSDRKERLAEHLMAFAHFLLRRSEALKLCRPLRESGMRYGYCVEPLTYLFPRTCCSKPAGMKPSRAFANEPEPGQWQAKGGTP